MGSAMAIATRPLRMRDHGREKLGLEENSDGEDIIGLRKLRNDFAYFNDFKRSFVFCHSLDRSVQSSDAF